MQGPASKETRVQELKPTHAFEGRRITPQLTCQPHPPKQRSRHEAHPKISPQNQTFRTVLSKRERHKDSQQKIERKPVRRKHDEVKEEKLQVRKEGSKSKSKSKGLSRSKSMKQLGKKSRSMVRLEPRREVVRQQRKSESPPYNSKSTTSQRERKQCKSNYNSKTTRQMVSELTTDRERLKAKPSKKPKMSKNESSKKLVFRKRSDKENVNAEGKSKGKKGKKEKRVLISEEYSKVRRECEQWQMSLNEDEFLNPRHPKSKSKSKGSNIVHLPKRKQRLSLNTNLPRKPNLKTKTEVELEHYHSKKQLVQKQAAIRIQSVFRGYLTRKYIKQCFQHNAAIKIQKVWRGHRTRLQLSGLRFALKVQKNELQSKIQNQEKIWQQQEYLLQRQSPRSQFKNSVINERWTSVLEQILSEQSVSSNIKKKIQFLLDSHHKSINQLQLLQAVRSPSARSSISSQVINNQIASEKHFIQQSKRRKQKPTQTVLFLSPKQFISPRRLHSSPQHHFSSPQNRFGSNSPNLSSTQLLVSNLKNIQKVHKVRLQSKANTQKQELNKMLIKNSLSPRTHQKRYKQVDQAFESELQKFNESINQIVKSCMVYGQDQDQVQIDALTTPKRQLAQLPLPGDVSPPCRPLGQEMSVEFREYYQANKDKDTFEQKVISYEIVDTGYQFIEEYLISLIDFVRQYEGGNRVEKVIEFLHRPRSHEMNTIIRNSNLVTEGSEEDPENSFRLPMYKYMVMEEEIFENSLIEEFNLVFPKLQEQLGHPTPLQEPFIKMIIDCMNQALNSLRPHSYPFAECQLSSINILKGLQKLPFQCESSQQEMNYQFICAQALNKIFYWNKLEWGKSINGEEGEDIQTRGMFLRDMENSIVQIHSQDQWHYYQELVEIIGLIGEQAFEIIVFQEIAAVWGSVIQWNQKMEKSNIQILPPNSKVHYLP